MPRAGSSTHEGRATLHVRRTAGEIVLKLLDGPMTSHDLEIELGTEQRSIMRAIREIELWGDVLDVTRPARHGHKGSRPYVYRLSPEWSEETERILRIMNTGHSNAYASIALALEGAA